MIDFKYMTSGNEERIYNYLNNLCHNQECFCNKVYIRFLNTSEEAGAIDIYVDDVMVAVGLKYGQITQYILSYPGDYMISVYKYNNRRTPLIEAKVSYNRNTIYTAAIICDDGVFRLHMIKEQKETDRPVDEAVISYINLADKYNSYDLFIGDGTAVYKNAQYCDHIPNILLLPSIEKFMIKKSNTSANISETPNIELKKGMYYSVYAIQGNGAARVFVIPNGLNYLDIC